MELSFQAVLIVALLIALGVIVYLLYAKTQAHRPTEGLQTLEGTVEPLDLSWCLADSLPSLSCYGTGSKLIIQRPLFHHLTPVNVTTLADVRSADLPAWFLGGRVLGPHEAMVLWGQIPTECPYWSLGGIRFEAEGPVSFGPAVTLRGSARQGIAVVLTSNARLFETLKTHLKAYWAASSVYSLTVLPLWLPRGAASRVTIWARCLLDYPQTPPPTWRAALFQSRGLGFEAAPEVELPKPKRHPSGHREQWVAAAKEIAQALNPLEVKAVKDPTDARDTTRFETGEIELHRGQKLIVVAQDQTRSGLAATSAVVFEEASKRYAFETRITGTASKASEGILAQRFEIDPWTFLEAGETLHLKVAELLFAPGVGPHPDDVLPMNVFIV